MFPQETNSEPASKMNTQLRTHTHQSIRTRIYHGSVNVTYIHHESPAQDLINQFKKAGHTQLSRSLQYLVLSYKDDLTPQK